MNVLDISIEDYLLKKDAYFLIDVRSEGEFKQGHIPGAINIPVLNDEERKVVGTIYKEIGNQKAVLKGFELAGARFHLMMKQALKLAGNKPLMIYCWRGGMRSQIFSWLMNFTGISVNRIKGGYKKYRTKTYETVRKEYDFIVMGGKTGCGKTEILHAMKNANFQVLDFEGLANHKGSAFGGIGMPEQPTNEFFENILAEEIWKLNAEKPIWVENENQLIGKIIIPLPIKNKMNISPLINIELSDEIRYKRIAEEYGVLDKAELISATKRLEKRLGNLRMKMAVEAIENDAPDLWIPLLMEYYDKGYLHAVDKTEKERITLLDITNMEMENILSVLLELERKWSEWKN